MSFCGVRAVANFTRNRILLLLLRGFRDQARRASKMATSMSRREFLMATGAGVASIALAELGLAPAAVAEDAFTVSLSGGSWGQGQIDAYIVGPAFEQKNN